MIQSHRPPTEAGRAQLALADLASAARSGPIGPATVLACVARVQRHIARLAEYEETADWIAADALDEQRARFEAIQAGTVILFPARPRLYTGQGGTAA